VPILVAAALVLNPMAVAVVGGTGGAIGELSGYFLGRSSRKVIKKDKLPDWLRRRAERCLPLTILLTSAIPSPFADAVAIIAGRLCCPVWKFLVLTIIGKVVQSTVLVHLALWNIFLVRSWFG